MQNRPDRGGGAGGGPKILVCYKTNDGVKKGGLGQNMNYDNDICIVSVYRCSYFKKGFKAKTRTGDNGNIVVLEASNFGNLKLKNA